MQLWKSVALLCTLTLASSTVVRADGADGSEGADAGSAAGNVTGSGSGNSTNSTAGDVTTAPGSGVPAPTSAAGYVTWQATVATFAATAVAVALV